MLQRIDLANRQPQVLVLTPTRELAIQVEESFRDYGKHLPIRTAIVYGGSDMNAQIAALDHQVANLAAQMHQQQVDVEDRTIKSPVPAVIDRTFVLPGEYVQSGQRILLLHNPDSLGFTHDAVWNGMERLREAKLTDEVLVGQLEAVRRTHGDSWRAKHLLALVHLEDAQKLFQLGDAVSGLRLRLDDLFAARSVARDLTAKLDRKSVV